MDFFLSQCATYCGTRAEFWLNDDAGDQSPAYVAYKCVEGCIAHVRNIERREVVFRAIDQCLPITDEFGNELSRCDCMLEYVVADEGVIFHFLELKQRKRKQWQKHGLGQLRETISLFKASYPNIELSRIKAQLSNSMRPSITTLRPEQLKRFKELGMQARNVIIGPEVVL